MRRARHVDVIVIGAGPAGLSAASAAAERGRSVLLVDQGLRAGGQIWRHRNEATLPLPAQRLMARARNAGVKLVTGCRLVDMISPQELLIDFRGRVDRHETSSVIIASGARERFLPFPGWTLPGVVGVGGLQALLKGGLPLAGRQVVIAGTGPLLFPVAASVARAGGKVMVVAEQASRAAVRGFAMTALRNPGRLRQAIGYRWAFRGAPYRTDSWVVRAEGEGQLRSIDLHEQGQARTVRCDWLAVGAGLVPNTEIAALFGCALAGDAIGVDRHQLTSVAGIFAAGECTGVKGEMAAMIEGEIAGRAAAGDLTGADASELQLPRAEGVAFGALLDRTFAPRRELLALADDTTVICRCEDVTRGAIDPAWTQRQAKLWTRVGMGACQGAVCGPACAAIFGWGGNAARPPLGAPLCGEWTSGLSSVE